MCHRRQEGHKSDSGIGSIGGHQRAVVTDLGKQAENNKVDSKPQPFQVKQS